MLRKRMPSLACFVVVCFLLSCAGNGNEVSNSNTSGPENTNPSTPTPTTTSTSTPVATTTPSTQANDPLRITAPTENAQVEELPFAEGTLPDANATVWLVVHPMEVPDYWVQAPASPREGTKWRLQIHIGRPGSDDVGKHFEIMAVANPKPDLKIGDKLKNWPTAKWKSPIVEVVRK